MLLWVKFYPQYTCALAAAIEEEGIDADRGPLIFELGNLSLVAKYLKKANSCT